MVRWAVPPAVEKPVKVLVGLGLAVVRAARGWEYWGWVVAAASVVAAVWAAARVVAVASPAYPRGRRVGTSAAAARAAVVWAMVAVAAEVYKVVVVRVRAVEV